MLLAFFCPALVLLLPVFALTLDHELLTAFFATTLALAHGVLALAVALDAVHLECRPQ